MTDHAPGSDVHSLEEIEPSRRPVRADRAAYALRALGRKGMPESFVIDGVTYRLTQTIKHDFWAATGFYADSNGRKVVLKMGRVEDFAGMPLEWIGTWLRNREVRFYNALSDLPNVPAVVGKVGKTGFVHDYVEGRPLAKNKPVPDGFFVELQKLMNEIHRRDIAYVDTNKPENILLGDDGKPHLIDFQISFDLHEPMPRFLARMILRRMQAEDDYHILKHKRRMRKDELTPDEIARGERKSLAIRVHRFLTKPYFLLRRRTFKRLRDAGRILPEGSR